MKIDESCCASQVSYITNTMTQLVEFSLLWHSRNSFVQHFMVCSNYKWKKYHLFEWHPWILIIPTVYFYAMLCHKSVDAFVRVLVRSTTTTTTRLLNWWIEWCCHCRSIWNIVAEKYLWTIQHFPQTPDWLTFPLIGV